MPVVIDGNNLLFAAQKQEPSSILVGRSILCDRLGMWADRCRESVHVVFDGPAPNAALAAQIGNPNIEVTYSGRGVTADSVLCKIVETDSAARRLVVVSSDREVAAAAKRRRARAVRSEDFWAGLQRTLARPVPRKDEPEEKEAGLTPEATEEWLREFGFDDPPQSAD